MISKQCHNLKEKTELQNKIIDLMAELITERVDSCPFEDYNYDLNCEKGCSENYIRCWKQYFENKAKEDKQ